jgi:hypothetical protein
MYNHEARDGAGDAAHWGWGWGDICVNNVSQRERAALDKDTVQVDLTLIRCKGVDYIQLVLQRAARRALASAVINLRAP